MYIAHHKLPDTFFCLYIYINMTIYSLSLSLSLFFFSLCVTLSFVHLFSSLFFRHVHPTSPACGSTGPLLLPPALFATTSTPNPAPFEHIWIVCLRASDIELTPPVETTKIQRTRPSASKDTHDKACCRKCRLMSLTAKMWLKSGGKSYPQKYNAASRVS